MAKSTIDDLLTAYRVGQRLRKAHKEKLIALLMEDLAGQRPAGVKPERKKKATKEEGQGA